MVKNLIKITITFLLIVLCMNFLCNICYASDLSDVVSGGDNFLSKSDPNIKVDENKLKDTSKNVYNILAVIGSIIVVVSGLIIGIKLMTSEAENRAEAQKSLMIWAIGSAIVFGAFAIWKVMVTFLNTL